MLKKHQGQPSGHAPASPVTVGINIANKILQYDFLKAVCAKQQKYCARRKHDGFS
jgi:hypothetical protein